MTEIKLDIDPRLTREQREVVSTIANAGNDVPAVLIVHRGEGEVVIGVRRLPGSLIAIS